MTDPMTPGDTQPFQPVAPEPVVATGVKPGSSRPRGSMWVNVALGVALLIAIGGVGFAAGRMTAPATAAAGGNGRFGGGQFPGGQFPGGGYFFQGGGNGGTGAGNGGLRGVFGNGGASVQGTVESVSGDTLTLKLAGGQTIQVSLSGTTTYHAETSASAGDVQTGGTVIVRLSLDRGEGGPTTPSASDVTIVP
ncbi:MAG TPA: hypothetical protein VGI98_00455 [Candidatus Limnocylindrales bacterium]|jgi:hypothetical protein